MVSRVRETFVIQGLDAVLTRKQRKTPPVAPIFDGERQAQLIALACSEPPEGYAHWTLRLLAEHAIERKIVETAHFNTVGRALKKSSQTAPEGLLGDPAQGKRCVRGCDGGRA